MILESKRTRGNCERVDMLILHAECHAEQRVLDAIRKAFINPSSWLIKTTSDNGQSKISTFNFQKRE